jgi:uncharacterized delta-60 repeat protein
MDFAKKVVPQSSTLFDLSSNPSQPDLNPAPSKSLLLIDSGVKDYQSLIDSAQPGTEVHLLQTGDAIAQITNLLLGRSGIESLQIVSHGRSGGIQLGSTWLDIETLDRYANQLQAWSKALTENADMLLYSCDVAAGATGQTFVRLLSQITGADVAASNDLTGNALLGGDWDLEVHTGTIETAMLLDAARLVNYRGTLAPGDLDLSFGSSGKIITPIVSSGDDFAQSVAIQSDGKIVVAGTAFNGTNYDFALARYTSAGVLDNTFGTGGKVISPIGPNGDDGFSVAIQSDDKIVVAGATFNGGSDFALIRYTSTGALDNTFGTGGKVISPIGLGDDVGRSMAIQSDGKIVVAGYASTGTRDFALARYTSAGVLDNTFGTDGKVLSPIGLSDDYGFSVAIQSDGKIVVAGYAFNGANEDFALARYTSTGALDNTFGTGGKVLSPIGLFNDYGYSVVIQSDGKIVVVGEASNGTNNDFALARYTSTGALDNTFGTGGKVLSPIGSSRDTGFSVAIQSDGKIVVVGGASNGPSRDFALARYDGVSLPSINLTASTATAIEGGTNGVYTISRDTATTGNLTVNLTLDGLSTASSADYTLSGGSVIVSGSTLTVVIPDGASSVTVDLAAIAESLQSAEAAETLTLNLATGTGYDIGTNNTATVTIAQNGFIVTNTNDSGEGSLRQAVLNANAIAGADTIIFVGSTFTDTTPDTITLTSGQIAISSDVTISGTGANLLTISGNSASRIFNIAAGNVNLRGLQIVNGSAVGGGGIRNSGTLSIFNSRLTGHRNVNTSESGGAILNIDNGTLTIVNSTLSGNTSNTSGGAISNINSTLLLINSTISGNTAGNFGGGAIRQTGGSSTLVNTTITNNTATGNVGGITVNSGSFTVGNSIIAANQFASAPDLIGTFSSQGNNLIGASNGTNGFVNGLKGDIVGTIAAPLNPRLGALANNGGTTQTHALLNDSPAINAGNNAALPTDTYDLDGDSNTTETLPVDQRGTGFARQIGSRVDIGAVESSVLNAQPRITLSATPIPYTENAAAILIDNTATVQDSDSTDFDTGVLIARIATGGIASDRLSIRNEGTGATQINLDGREIYYGNTKIGTFSGGIGTSDLTILLNANANPTNVQALVRNLTYANVSENPTAAIRVVELTLSDGDGAISAASQKTIQVTTAPDAPIAGQPFVLYDGTTNRTPDQSGAAPNAPWLFYQDTKALTGGNATAIANANGTQFSSDNSIYAGYSNYTTNLSNPFAPQLVANPNFPTLNRTAGYVLTFKAQLISETTRTGGADKNLDGVDDRAGFSVILLSSDNKGIELGFWANRIWAQEDGSTQKNPSQEPDTTPTNPFRTFFTQAESATFDTTTLTDYSLAILGDTYTLSTASGTVILSGRLRDYSAFQPQSLGPVQPPNPYNKPNFVFFGDNTPQAGATFRLEQVAIARNSNFNNVTTNEDQAISVPFSVVDLDTASVSIVPSSSNTTLVPNANLTLAGTGRDRTLTITPAANQNGTATLTVAISDGTLTTNRTINLTVNPVNDVPNFTKGADQTVVVGATAQSVANWATGFLPGPADESTQTVAAYEIVNNSNPSLFSVAPAIATNGTLTYTPGTTTGTATLTVRVKDNGGTANGGIDTSATQTFTITVNPQTVSLSATNATATEVAGNTGTYRISRDASGGAQTIAIAISGTASVADYNFSLAAASVTAGATFTITGNTISLNLPNGVISADLIVTPVDDIQAEAAETVQLDLATGSSYTIGTAKTGIVTIAQNDFVVTNTNDSGEGSLRQAILNANAIAGTDTITFNLPTGVQTIVVNPLPNLTESVNIKNTTGTSNLIIQGIATTFRLLEVSAGATASFEQFTLKNSLFGIQNRGTISLLKDLTITEATGTGLSNSTNSTINLIDGLQLIDNSSNALTNDGTITTIVNTRIHNTVSAIAGLSNFSTGILTRVLNTTISGNALIGARNFGQLGTLANVTISGNDTGLENSNTGTIANITNITIAGSTTLALDNQGTISALNNSLFAGNGNTAIAGGTITTQANNLSGTFAATGLSSTLANNGGMTETHALLNSSAAIDAGNNASLPLDAADLDRDSNTTETLPVDQRDLSRIQGSRVDIGAFESQLPSISISSPSTTEGNANTLLTFVVSLSTASTDPVTVNYATADATATTADSDYTAQTGTLTFNPNETSKTITVNITGDINYEQAENFRVNLSNAVNASIATATGTGTINNDDARPTLTIANATPKLEGDSGTVDHEFVVSLSARSFEQVRANVSTVNGTATAGTDYSAIAPNTSVTFNPGETLKTITVKANGDTRYETDETFTVRLGSPLNGAIAGTGEATGTILKDNDLAPTVSIANAVAQAENGTTPSTFVVSLAAASEIPAIVTYATQDGTAKSTEDYVAQSGTLTFNPGETSKTITVNLTDDTKFEGSQDFSVRLTNATDAAIATATGTATIIDNEVQPSLTIAPTTPITEGNTGTTPAVFTVNLSQASEAPVTVNYTTADGTATTTNNDYVATSGTLTFNNDERSKTITVNINGDTNFEADETFELRLSNPSGASLATTSVTQTITKDDAAPTVQVTPVSKAEGNTGTTAFVFDVALSGASYEAIALNYTTQNGTAQAGSDYVQTTGTVTLQAGQTATQITVNINGDKTYEADETFSLILSTTSQATLASTSIAGTIQNDEDTAQILWRNYQSGELSLWNLRDTTLRSYESLATVTDLNWVIEATEDLDGDGDADLLWHNYQTGQVSTWTMNGNTRSFYTTMAPVPNLDWRIATTADFNNDSKRDILWRNIRTGEVAIWTLNGFDYQADFNVLIGDLNWNIEQVGDFTGDGKADILWRDRRNGATDIWQMNGTQFERRFALYGAVSLDWRIVGLQDFDRDGDLDIVWENFNSREISFWELNAGSFTTSRLLPQLSTPYWSVAGLYDFNVDGNTDLLFRNLFTGEVMVWNLNGSNAGTQQSVYILGDLDWTIEGVNRFA